MQKITPFLLFDGNAEEALQLYTSVFKDEARILSESRYGQHGPMPEGTLMSATFSLYGHEYIVFNGGPKVAFSDAISLMVLCESQAEIDSYWDRLGDGGMEMPCGWLRDRFGLTWQIVPKGLDKMLMDPDPAKAGATMQAMLKMKKMDMAELQNAYSNA